MKVINIHSRDYPVASAEVGRLIDTLSSENDLLWPHQLWPRMKFDRPLSVAAEGGHGPIISSAARCLNRRLAQLR